MFAAVRGLAARMKTITMADGTSARSADSLIQRCFGGSALVAIVAAGLVVVTSSGAAPAPAPSVDASVTNDALHTLQSRCERGDAVSCNDLGVSTLRGSGDVAPDASAAAHAFELACSASSPDGCGNLGALYESGAGVQADLWEAARLYAHACSLGGALACSNLGALYARGRGVERDLDAAQRLFARACEAGSAAGCNNQLQLTSPRL